MGKIIPRSLSRLFFAAGNQMDLHTLNTRKMILEIGIGLAAVLTSRNIFKNVRTNYKLTAVITKKQRRALLWRFGPFKMGAFVVDQIKRTDILCHQEENNAEHIAHAAKCA